MSVVVYVFNESDHDFKLKYPEYSAGFYLGEFPTIQAASIIIRSYRDQNPSWCFISMIRKEENPNDVFMVPYPNHAK